MPKKQGATFVGQRFYRLIQFSFGGLWSAFLVFYSRSAVIATSWPFLGILFLIFVGNEIFREYRSRLVFTAILLFFAIYSYAVFVAPIILGTIDLRTFMISGIATLLVFVLFIVVLWLLAHSRIARDIRKILIGAIFISMALNGLYYMNVLPPLPLALVDAGIFSSKGAVEQKLRGVAAIPHWYQRSQVPLNFEIPKAQALYAYGAVFAPTGLTTRIVHEWEWYDPAKSQWVSQTVLNFSMNGGRENGFRGYSFKENLRSGRWRVDIETLEGRVTSRLNFAVTVR